MINSALKTTTTWHKHGQITNADVSQQGITNQWVHLLYTVYDIDQIVLKSNLRKQLHTLKGAVHNILAKRPGCRSQRPLVEEKKKLNMASEAIKNQKTL